MAEAAAEQSRDSLGIGYGVAAVVAVVLCARGLLLPGGADSADRVIKDSALFPVIAWCIGWPVVLARCPERPLRRFAWALGSVLCFVHVAVAFHLGHGWSHQAAWEHTRQIGGYGDGIYVNYTFAMVWLADVVWACVAFRSYLARPQWLNWTIHGFLAFVVLNAAVVFGSWDMRGAFVVFLLIFLPVEWYPLRRSGAKSANPVVSGRPDSSA